MNLGRYAEASTDFDAAIRIDSDYAYAYYNRGLAKNFLGLVREARRNFQKALNLAEIVGGETLKDLIMK